MAAGFQVMVNGCEKKLREAAHDAPRRLAPWSVPSEACTRCEVKTDFEAEQDLYDGFKCWCKKARTSGLSDFRNLLRTQSVRVFESQSLEYIFDRVCRYG